MKHAEDTLRYHLSFEDFVFTNTFDAHGSITPDDHRAASDAMRRAFLRSYGGRAPGLRIVSTPRSEESSFMALKIDKVQPRKKGERDSRTIVVSIPTHDLLMKESERTGRSVRWLADAAVQYAFQDKKPEGAS